MRLEIMQFKYARIGRRILIPACRITAGAVIACIDFLLNRVGDMPIMWLGDTIDRQEDILAHTEIGAAAEPGGDGVSLLGTEFPSSPAEFSPILGDVSQFFGSDNFVDVFFEEFEDAVFDRNR